MRRSVSAAAVLAALVLGVFASASCGGSPQTSPGSPSPTAGAITIDILGINGARSFSPNPATVPPGQTVVWHNLDIVIHRVVLDDGRLDTGDIGPGRFSASMVLIASGPYHCSIHPPMVGRIDGGR